MMMRAVILLIAVLAAVRGDDCVPRQVGENAIVCVCNSTYCDSVTEVQVKKNQYVWYTSTMSGQRLQSTIASFSNEIKPSNLVLTLDSSQKYQTICGFGGAMTDSTALNIRTLSSETQRNLIESYYSAKGSLYTFCRIPIAGTDFSTRAYTYDDTPGDVTLSNFNLVEEDDYKIGYLHQIMNVMPNSHNLKIFTAAWSAPPWMKDTDNIQWGVLKREYYLLYADYIRKFFDAYKEKGIKIWGMTPGNEPINGIVPNFSFNAMLWTPETEANFSANFLEPTLSKAGYNDIVYMALDDQRFEIPWYPDGVFKNEKANEIFKGTAVHWYADYMFKPYRLDLLHEKYPDKFILMTEACTGANTWEEKKVDLGSWTRGEQYVTNIIQNLAHWICGWVDWNLALNEQGAPNWAKNYVDSPIIVMPKSDEFYKQPMFYAIQHFSKFVPPNSTRIFSSHPFNLGKNYEYESGIWNYEDNTIAFLTPDGKIVTVIINRNDEPYDITVEDKMMPDKLMHLTLPEKSFTTLIYQAHQ